MMPGEQPVEERCACAADMKIAGRRGSEKWCHDGLTMLAIKPGKRAGGRSVADETRGDDGEHAPGHRSRAMPSAAAGCSGYLSRWGWHSPPHFELPSEPALWLGPVIAGRLRGVRARARRAQARAVHLGVVAAAVGAGAGLPPGGPRISPLRRSAVPCSASMSRVASPISSVCLRASGWCWRRCGWKGNYVPPPEVPGPARSRVSLSKGAPPLSRSATASSCWPISRRPRTGRAGRL